MKGERNIEKCVPIKENEQQLPLQCSFFAKYLS